MRLAILTLAFLACAAPASAQRDRGINQPGALGNRGVPGVGVGAPGVGVVDPGINQPGAVGNVPAAAPARRAARRY